jgi:hypothetical protein
VVGAHPGSMEADVTQIAQRFDRDPNIKYQDRILYATDLVVMPKDDTEKALAE